MNTYEEYRAYKNLSAATVEQAVRDYKTALKKLWKLEEKIRDLDGIIKDCEGFFDSEWIKELVDIDGKYIKNNAAVMAKEEYDKLERVNVRITISRKDGGPIDK